MATATKAKPKPKDEKDEKPLPPWMKGKDGKPKK